MAGSRQFTGKYIVKENFELVLLRNEIDCIDKELVHLLARRFRTVDQVIAIKQRACIPAHIQSRVDEVVANAKADAFLNCVPPDSIERLWRLLVDETILYEKNHGVSPC
jgi:isochorismate pyruvate lyase